MPKASMYVKHVIVNSRTPVIFDFNAGIGENFSFPYQHHFPSIGMRKSNVRFEFRKSVIHHG